MKFARAATDIIGELQLSAVNFTLDIASAATTTTEADSGGSRRFV